MTRGDEATEDDLREIFRMYVGRRRRKSAAYARSQGSEESFINPMQFSLLWRQITGERGNLFREMQMFKLFDVDGFGILTEDDFVRGWAVLAQQHAQQQDRSKGSINLLVRMKLLLPR